MAHRKRKRKPRAPRKRFENEEHPLPVTLERRKALLLAALRVWELKHRMRM